MKAASYFSGDRGFGRLAFGAALVTFIMITIGAITRVSESGYGCGPYWLTCNGEIIPTVYTLETAIEFGHRLFALIVGGFSLAVLIRARRTYAGIPRLTIPAYLGFLLFLVQSALGGLTVALYRDAPDRQWQSVLFHLAVSMLIMACYVILWVNARSLIAESPLQTLVKTPRPLISVNALGLTSAMSFLVAIVGAAVRGTQAMKACVGFPLCDGELLPVNQGALQMLNMTHRLAAGGLGVLLLLLIVQVILGGGEVSPPLRRALFLAGGVYLLQAGLGALIVLTDDRTWLLISRSLHVTFAAGTWAVIITASSLAWLHVSPNRLPLPTNTGERSSTPHREGAPSALISS
ncbi:MAG TPA: COX15/CtaA family protein [Aggregatilineales bacterium]|nr:COX15/CtaA family protein [Anaerolineales bacterium]HRE48899.1 COX15/CtaA family protein [Aggregatilineales bacterium]